MFTELLDFLRCPQPHGESHLVAAVRRREGRVILEGSLGCPACARSYAITGGVARFGAPDPARGEHAPARTIDGQRLAAQLRLDEPGAIVVLFGVYAAVAEELVEDFSARVIAVNSVTALAAREGLAALSAGDVLPLASGFAGGIAYWRTNVSEAAATRLLRPGGRVVCDAETRLPSGVTELARDDEEWVGELGAHVRTVPLTRAEAR